MKRQGVTAASFGTDMQTDTGCNSPRFLHDLLLLLSVILC
jgi:hypothetical protein